MTRADNIIGVIIAAALGCAGPLYLFAVFMIGGN